LGSKKAKQAICCLLSKQFDSYLLREKQVISSLMGKLLHPTVARVRHKDIAGCIST
jgi:hypothetical protein